MKGGHNAVTQSAPIRQCTKPPSSSSSGPFRPTRRTSALDELRDREYARLDRTGQVYLDYTGGGLYAEQPAPRTPRPSAAQRVRQPALKQPDLTGHDLPDRRGAALRPRVFQRAAGRVRRHLHAERQRRAQARRRGLPLCAGRALPAHLRQPQLGQRDPGVRAAQGRGVHLRAGRRARAADRHGGPRSRAGTSAARRSQPVCLPGAVQLLGRRSTRWS